jgi:hypothetical protein
MPNVNCPAVQLSQVRSNQHQYTIEQRENGGRGQKNLSGTNFHGSPEGVRLRDEPSNLTARQFN